MRIRRLPSYLAALACTFVSVATASAASQTVPAVVIPGFGVSRLYDPGTHRYVWGTPSSVVHTEYPDDLDLEWDAKRGEFVEDRLVARGFVGSRGPINTAWHISEGLRLQGYRATYERGVAFADATANPFAWDWRLGLEESTAKLDAFIEEIRRAHGHPDLKVDLVTHSAGGMLALLYLRIGTAPLERPDLWSKEGASARAKVRRVVLIAPPQEGVTDPLRIAVQPERFIRRTFTPEMVATWPSVVELLPDDGRFVVDESGRTLDADLHTANGWRALRAGVFDPAVRDRVTSSRGEAAYRALLDGFTRSLDRAARFREAMRRDLTGVDVTIIAGDCVETPRRAMRRSDGTFVFYRRQLRKGEESLARLFLDGGDGTVPIGSARGEVREDVQIVCAGHQSLAGSREVQRLIAQRLREREAAAVVSGGR